MYKEGLALNNLQWLICHKTQPNQTKPNPVYLIYMYEGGLALNNPQWLICHRSKADQTKLVFSSSRCCFWQIALTPSNKILSDIHLIFDLDATRFTIWTYFSSPIIASFFLFVFSVWSNFPPNKLDVGWLVGFYGISTLMGLFNAKSIFMQIISSISNNSV